MGRRQSADGGSEGGDVVDTAAQAQQHAQALGAAIGDRLAVERILDAQQQLGQLPEAFDEPGHEPARQLVQAQDYVGPDRRAGTDRRRASAPAPAWNYGGELSAVNVLMQRPDGYRTEVHIGSVEAMLDQGWCQVAD